MILLADDSRLMRLETEYALIKGGFRVCSAADGEQALQIARDAAPDVILLDMMLPKLSGQEVLRRLKEDPSTADIPVIVFTGLSQKNEQKLRDEGAVAFFQKSNKMFTQDLGELLDLIESVSPHARRN